MTTAPFAHSVNNHPSWGALQVVNNVFVNRVLYLLKTVLEVGCVSMCPRYF